MKGCARGQKRTVLAWHKARSANATMHARAAFMVVRSWLSRGEVTLFLATLCFCVIADVRSLQLHRHPILTSAAHDASEEAARFIRNLVVSNVRDRSKLVMGTLDSVDILQAHQCSRLTCWGSQVCHRMAAHVHSLVLCHDACILHSHHEAYSNDLQEDIIMPRDAAMYTANTQLFLDDITGIYHQGCS